MDLKNSKLGLALGLAMLTAGPLTTWAEDTGSTTLLALQRQLVEAREREAEAWDVLYDIGQAIVAQNELIAEIQDEMDKVDDKARYFELRIELTAALNELFDLQDEFIAQHEVAEDASALVDDLQAQIELIEDSNSDTGR